MLPYVAYVVSLIQLCTAIAPASEFRPHNLWMTDPHLWKATFML
jgi:hypothetical protein